MASDVILHAGYDVRQLGADLPIAEVAAAVARHRPSVVGLTTAGPCSAVNVPPAIEAIRRANPGTGIVVGGRGADDRLATGPDVVVCRHVADAVDNVDALVKRAGHN
jgi:methanogenic corrinoid protein MtbC1